MIKYDIVARVVNRTGLSKTKAEMAVETVFATMKKAMERGSTVPSKLLAAQCRNDEVVHRDRRRRR